MIAHHVAREATPADRGRGLGERFAGEIAANLDVYGALFERTAGLGGDEVRRLGGRALERIAAWSPALAGEIEGIAAGAGQPAAAIAALNARTELLALGSARRGECTVAARLGDGPPVAVQTWDWHEELAGGWHVLTVDAPGARRLHTLTEYGIVGKVGVNASGVGVLVNILHHESDGGGDAGPGVPVHVVARRVLDDAGDVNDALLIAGSAAVSASSSLTVVADAGGESGALSIELCPAGTGHVLPAPDGVLVHTNHFLAERGRAGDLEPQTAPDTLVRLDVVRRRLTAAPPQRPDEAIAALCSHLGGAGAVCCHPAEGAPLGERYATLATVAVDARERTLAVRRGGPCEQGAEHWRGEPLRGGDTDTTTKETGMKLGPIDNLDILTHDPDGLARFYHETLELPLLLPWEPGQGWAAIDAGTTIYIFESEVGEHEPRRTPVNPENPPGFDSFALTVEDLDAAIEWLDAKGVEWAGDVTRWDHESGRWYRYRPFYDPDGNMLYVTEPHAP